MTISVEGSIIHNVEQNNFIMEDMDMAKYELNYKVEMWDVVKDVHHNLGEYGASFENAIKEGKQNAMKNPVYFQLKANGLVISEARVVGK